MNEITFKNPQNYDKNMSKHLIINNNIFENKNILAVCLPARIRNIKTPPMYLCVRSSSIKHYSCVGGADRGSSAGN